MLYWYKSTNTDSPAAQYDPFADAVEEEEVVEEEEKEGTAPDGVSDTPPGAVSVHATEGAKKKTKIVEKEGHGTGWQFGIVKASDTSMLRPQTLVAEGPKASYTSSLRPQTRMLTYADVCSANADAEGLKFGLWNALKTYKHYKASWTKIMRRCMKTDFSWQLSAKKYEQVD